MHTTLIRIGEGITERVWVPIPKGWQEYLPRERIQWLLETKQRKVVLRLSRIYAGNKYQIDEIFREETAILVRSAKTKISGFKQDRKFAYTPLMIRSILFFLSEHDCRRTWRT